MLQIERIDTRKENVRPALNALRERLSPRGDVVSEASRQRTIDVFGAPLTPLQVVEKICGDVQEGGVTAVLDYTQKLDGAQIRPDTLRVTAAELAAAHASAEPEFLATVARVRENIHGFQSAILHQDVTTTPADGVTLCQRYHALERIGVCVPGGAAAYPSTVLMTVVPALAAGVEQIAIVAPPTDFGANNPDLLATCHELGIQEVYRMGGAQAVAALAYGVEGVPSVDMVVGPGNLFVALAKKHVYGDVNIDSIAGPSEVVVLADSGAVPSHIAADMLAQAEHAPGASVLIVWQDGLLDAIYEELARQVAVLSRSELTIHSLQEFGTLIRVADVDEAVSLTNEIAPEHLHIATANAGELAKRIRHAGATFLGYFSPVAVGDYAAGPSHVLPTGGTARWASGLSSNSFLRSSSVIEFTPDALSRISGDVRNLANKEGLTAHRESVDIRITDNEGS